MKTSQSIKRTAAKIRLIFFDFDGVFTNNKVIVDENGNEFVVCNRSDGIGLSKLRELGVEMMILSSESNTLVVKRARKLKIPCIHNCDDKYGTLNKIIKKKNIDIRHVAFMGNDINDKLCLVNVGLPIVVADAHKDVLRLGAMVTKAKGGEGAVREVCDFICTLRKIGMNE